MCYLFLIYLPKVGGDVQVEQEVSTAIVLVQYN